jgi:hypothetical protein
MTDTMATAMVNVTYEGFNSDFPDPVLYDSTDADLKLMIIEALENGYLPGIPAQTNVSLDHFVIDRFNPSSDNSNNEIKGYRIFCRPKTPFGIY